MRTDSIQTDAAEPDGALAEALQRLDIAVQTSRMYPASAPTVVQSVEVAHASLVAAIGDEPVSLQIRPQEISWVDRLTKETQSAILERLAEQLHRRHVARLTLGPGLSLESVLTLIGALAQREFEHNDDALLLGTIPGIRADPLELQGLVDGGSQRFDPDDVWGQILAEFGSGTDDSPDWEGIALDAERARGFLRWALDPEHQPAAMAHHSQTDGFTLLVEQIAGRAPQVENLIETLVEASTSLFDELDLEAWIDILTDPLPLQTDEASAPVDLTKRLAKALSSGQVMRLVNYTMSSRSRATPRLYKFLSRVVASRPERSEIANRAVQMTNSSPVELAKAWPDLIEVMTGENPDPFLHRDYRALLEDDSEIGKSAWNSAKVRARFGELDGDSLRVRKTRIAHSLLVSNRESRFYEHLVDALGSSLETIVRMGELTLLEEILLTLAQHISDADRPGAERQLAHQALLGMQQRELIVLLVQRLARAGGDGFHALWRIVEHLGQQFLPELLQALATTRSPSYRHHLLRILRGVSELPLEEFGESLNDRRTPYVRDFVWLLAELRRPELAPLLQAAATHADAKVRSEALGGFAFLSDEPSELALLEALADTSLEVRVAALRAFRQRFASRSQERLLGYLSLPNWNGENTRLIAAALSVLGQIGDEAALAAIVPLARRTWIFRRRRRTVTQAAIGAVQSINQRAQQRSAAAPQPQETTRAA